MVNNFSGKLKIFFFFSSLVIHVHEIDQIAFNFISYLIKDVILNG